MKKVIVVSMFSVCLSSPAVAEFLFQPYLGLVGSYYDIDAEKSFDDTQFFSADKDDEGFGVVLGARVFESGHVFAELEYNYDHIDADLDTSDTLPGNKGSNEAKDTHTLATNLHYAFTAKDSVYARLGVVHGRFSTEGAAVPLKHSFTETGFLYGLGYRRALSEHWAVRLDYSVVDFESDTKINSNGSVIRIEEAEFEKLSLALTYRF